MRNGQVAGVGEPGVVIGDYIEAMNALRGGQEAVVPGFLYHDEAAAGTKDAWITSLQLLDDQGRVLTGAATWDCVRFRIGFEASRAFRSFAAELRISTTNGVPLILTSTSPDQNVPFGVAPGRYLVDCRFDRLPLAGGEYVIGLGLAIPGVEYVWRKDSVCKLNVAARDVFGSGRPPNSTRSLVATPHQWSSPESRVRR
jgi:hypothetical protein